MKILRDVCACGTVPHVEPVSPRCLTFAGLPVSCGDEAHVALAAVASRQVQAVAALAQVAVLRALVAVCSHTHTHTARHSQRQTDAKLLHMCVALKSVCVT